MSEFSIRERARRVLTLMAGHPARRWAERLLWVALVAFVSVRMWPQLAAAAGIASASGDAPHFTLTTLDGTAVSTESLAGKVVLLNFWATWCPPCRVEMPGFQQAYERFRDDGFVVLGVSMDAGGSAGVRQFLEERNITYPVAMATPAVVREFDSVRLLPTSFLIDREGRIRNEVKGVFTAVALEQAVGRLLREPPPTTNAARATP